MSGAQTYWPAFSFATIPTTEPELTSTRCANAGGVDRSATAKAMQSRFILDAIGRAFGGTLRSLRLRPTRRRLSRARLTEGVSKRRRMPRGFLKGCFARFGGLDHFSFSRTEPSI